MYYESITGVIFPKIYFRELNDRTLVRTCAYAAYYSNIEKSKSCGGCMIKLNNEKVREEFYFYLGLDVVGYLKNFTEYPLWFQGNMTGRYYPKLFYKQQGDCVVRFAGGGTPTNNLLKLQGDGYA